MLKPCCTHKGIESIYTVVCDIIWTMVTIYFFTCQNSRKPSLFCLQTGNIIKRYIIKQYAL